MIKEIQSVNNPYIKDLSKLKEKKYRLLNQKYIIEGYHLVFEASKKGVLKEVLFVDEKDLIGINKDVNFVKVNKDIINKLSDTTNPQSIIGICEMKDVDVCYDNHNHILVLDGINDPGNLGTLIRSALGFDIDLIVLGLDTVDLYNSKSIRASQGAMFALPIVYRDLSKEIDLIKASEIKVIGTALDSSEPLNSIIGVKRYAIILGNEARGMKEVLKEKTDINVIIPTKPQLESLNVSIAGSIVMFALYENNLFTK